MYITRNLFKSKAYIEQIKITNYPKDRLLDDAFLFISIFLRLFRFLCSGGLLSNRKKRDLYFNFDGKMLWWETTPSFLFSVQVWKFVGKTSLNA